MKKEHAIALFSQLVVVVAGVLAADIIKSQMAKSKMTKPLEVKSE